MQAKPETTRAITLQDATTMGVLTRDLDEIACLWSQEMPARFLDCQGDDVRTAAWAAALKTADETIRAKLRALGVMA
jgi:hypothetical protein